MASVRLPVFGKSPPVVVLLLATWWFVPFRPQKPRQISNCQKRHPLASTLPDIIPRPLMFCHLHDMAARLPLECSIDLKDIDLALQGMSIEPSSRVGPKPDLNRAPYYRSLCHMLCERSSNVKNSKLQKPDSLAQPQLGCTFSNATLALPNAARAHRIHRRVAVKVCDYQKGLTC